MLYEFPTILMDCIQGSDLAFLQDEATSALSPTLRLSRFVCDDEKVPLGVSKMGGCPDVPQGFCWPVCNDTPQTERYETKQTYGGPLWFIGQINTSDLARHKLHVAEDGLLSFFGAVQRDGFPQTGGNYDDWKVFYFPRKGLRRASPPLFSPEFLNALKLHDYELPLNGKPCFKAARVEFTTLFALPPEWPSVAANFKTGLERRFSSILRATRPIWLERPLHLLGGYPQLMNTAPRTLGPKARRVFPLMFPPDVPIPAKVQAEREDNAEWILLAQFDTDEDLQLYWAGWGRAYFMIRKNDWLTGNWNRVVLLNDHT